MDNFIYHNIIDEFKSYLESNLSETIYFESLRLKNYIHSKNELSYRDIISDESFAVNSVLDKHATSIYARNIRSLNKVRSYRKYADSEFDELNINSDFHKRLGTIQILCTMHTMDKKSYFEQLSPDILNFPTVVKIPYLNFDLTFSEDPFRPLSELLKILTDNENTRGFYMHFIDYYFSNQDINEIILANLKDSNQNSIAFIIAILYVYSVTENNFRLPDEKLILKALNKIYKAIPKSIDQDYLVCEKVKSKFELAVR